MGYAAQIKRTYELAVPKKVTRAAAALPQGVPDDLFTIAVGPVSVILLYGQVTVQIGNVANNTHLTFNPTTGVVGNMTAVLDIDDRDVDTLFGISAIATALLGVDNAGVLEGPRGSEWGKLGLEMEPGVIILNCAGSDGGGGRVVWYLWYVPLAVGANVVAA